MKNPKINKVMIRHVLKHIKEDLRRLNMCTWGTKVDPESAYSPPCGTRACFAGWAVLLNTPKDQWPYLFHLDFNSGENRMSSYTREQATKLLGFNRNEAISIFGGVSLSKRTSEGQYNQLVRDINKVLKNRGLTAIKG